MIGFFRRKPAIGLSVFLGLFFAGGVFAHQLDKIQGPQNGKGLPLLLTKSTSLLGRPASVSSSWREQLDIDRAEPIGDRLGQRLKDGSIVTYTLDPQLQKWAQKYLAQWNLPYGAMVMMDVATGKVLAMAGHSNRSEQIDTEALCLSPWAPAASVYKLITAAALLENGVLAEEKVCYHGGLHGINKDHIVDNSRWDTTCRDLNFAIANSVNPIMAKLALRHLSRSQMEEWSNRFGFNRSIPFELPVKPSKAEIPSTDLERARVAAGFWHTEASPLHGALIAEIGATRGVIRWPRIVESVTTKTGQRETIAALSPDQRVMSQDNADKLAQMMVETTTKGTAHKSFMKKRGKPTLPGGIEVAGKTGSLSRANPFLHYNWFVGFAPADKPQVAFAVLVGNPVAWKVKAHAAARSMLDQYFSPSRRNFSKGKSSVLASRQ